MATFQDLVTVIREEYLSDIFTGYDTATAEERNNLVLWKDSVILSALNKAQEEATFRENLISDNYTSSVSLIAGQKSYTLDDELVQIDSAIINNSELIHRTKDSMRYDYPTWRTDAQATPTVFFVKGNTLTVYPTPDIPYTLDIEGKSYHPSVPQGILTDNLSIPARYQKDLIWYALHNLYLLHDIDATDYATEKGAEKFNQLASYYLEKFDSIFGKRLDARIVANLLETPMAGSYNGPIDTSTSVANLVNIIREDYLPNVFKSFELVEKDQIKVNRLFTDSQIVRFIEKAQIEACHRKKLLIDNFNYNINALAGTASYDLDPQTIQINHVTLSDGTILTHKTRDSMDYDYPNWRATADAPPQLFFVKGKEITFYPTPDANETILVEGRSYHATQYNLTLADNLVIPERYHVDLVWYVLYLTFTSPGLHNTNLDIANYLSEKAKEYYGRFEEVFGEKLEERVITNLLEKPSETSYSGDIGSKGTVRRLVTALKEDYLPNMLKGIDLATMDDVKYNKIFNDSQLIRFIEEAQDEACKRDKLIQHDQIFTINIVQGVKEYALDPLIRQIHHAGLFDIDYNYLTDLTHVPRVDADDINSAWRSATAVQPVNFYIHGRTLYLLEEPITDYTLELECDSHHQTQIDINIDTLLSIPEEDAKHLLWYVLHLCYLTHRSDPDNNDASKNMSISESYLQKFDMYFGARLDERTIIHQLEQPRVGSILPINYWGNIEKDEVSW